MKKTTIDKVLTILKWTGCILIIMLLILPYFAIYFWLRKNKKQLILYPEIKIEEIKNENEMDVNALSDAVNASKSILRKLGIKE